MSEFTKVGGTFNAKERKQIQEIAQFNQVPGGAVTSVNGQTGAVVIPALLKTGTEAAGNSSVVLVGNETGNDAQGNPLPNARSSPLIEMHTSQVSYYRSNEAGKGGYSELIRLVADTRKAKPTIAWYNQYMQPSAWIVAHEEPQDLQIFATQSAFPATGVYNGSTCYLAVDQNNTNKDLGYYIWNTTTLSYQALLKTDFRFWYMAKHQHISIETSDTTDVANYSRFAIPYGFDVPPIFTANAHFVISSGEFNGKKCGAFVNQEGKTYSSQPLIFYPNALCDLPTLYKDSNTDNIFTLNTLGLTMLKLLANETGNLAVSEDLLCLSATTGSHLQVNKFLIVREKFGIGVKPDFTQDIKSDDQSFSAGEHIVTRITRDGTSYLVSGYVADGTTLTGYYTRPTGSKSYTLGTTGQSNAIVIDGATGQVNLNSNLSFTNTAKAGLIANKITTSQKTSLGAVENGAIVYDTTLNKLQIRENGAWKTLSTQRTEEVLYLQLATKVVTNTTTETTGIDVIGSTGYSNVLAANSILVNDRLRIEVVGRYTTSAVSNPVTLRLKIGSTTMMNPDPVSIIFPPSITQGQFRITYNIKVVGIGASGSFTTDTELQAHMMTPQRYTTAGSDVVDTTVNNTVDFTAQFTTATTTESIDIRDIQIRKISVS